MEVAQRYSIAWKGLKNGRHDFRFEVDKALFEAFESTEIKDGRCEVSVGVDRSEKQLTLDVGITGHVVVECDRCLEDCRVPIDFEGQLVVKFSDEVHEYDGEVMWMLPGEDRVELAQYIYESIVLSLPYQRVHPEGEWPKAPGSAAGANGPSWPPCASGWRPKARTAEKAKRNPAARNKHG